MFKNGERVQLKCLYCGKVFKGGGIHRIKEHLAGQKGNASTCLRVPADVRIVMQESLDGVVVKKRKKQKIADEITNVNPISSEIDTFTNHVVDVNTGLLMLGEPGTVEASSSMLVSQEGTSNVSGDRRKRGRGKSSAVEGNALSVSTVGLGAKRLNNPIHMAIGKFLFDIGAPLDAVNSVYFQGMVDAIVSGGSGASLPSWNDLEGWILNKSVEEVKSDNDKIIAAWARTGCSILVNKCSTQKGRILLNFLAYCPEGTVFLKSLDGSGIINSSDALYELIKQVVEEVGFKHVVQVITSGEEQFIVAGRRLTETFPTLYWTPCAAHCIDLILEDFAKLARINAVIEQARSITRFVYNHSFVLNMVRRYTFGIDIVDPAVTRSATNFTTLKRMVDLQSNLENMVTSEEWMDCLYSKKPGGLEMLDIVSNKSFWSSCALITQLTNPLLQVLRIAGSKKRPAMGYVYAGMYRAKEKIKKELIRREEREDYMVYWNIIDRWWEQQWHHPLHTAGFYLNPKFFYSIEGHGPNEMHSGMLDCMEKLVADGNVQDKISKEMNSYKNAAGDFGRKMAVRARDTLLPAEWWSTYGGSCPNLARLAIRILSQTCSTLGLQQNHFYSEKLHETKNLLEQQRFKDLIFVHCNLQLRQIGSETKEPASMPLMSFDATNMVEDWVMGNDTFLEDYTYSEWTALDPVSGNKMLLGPSTDEFEELGAGFDDYEIFNRVKDGDN
ncbi:putative Zinc finger, BED-type [Corchorus capsularis]|uniref:Putative Zinc finger, BED-type n=1 Tax=Corchorus capsularis TaxID=210143 RepID=A0A1R3GLS4_COCAP|nr:putative Zinc finger, BED-type [Corchorus capsularis]